MSRRWRVALLIIAVSITATAVATRERGAAAVYVSGDLHWAVTGGVAKVPILVGGSGAAVQAVADAAASWSEASHVDMGVAGYMPDGTCIDPATETLADFVATYPEANGYVVVCFDRYDSGGGWTYVSSECAWAIAIGSTSCVPEQKHHLAVTRTWIRDATPIPYVVCNELGHTLGLSDGAGGCMSYAVDCPDATALGYLDALYGHDDGYASAASTGGWVVAGVDRCVGTTSTATATSTPEPSPTPTVTSSPTPTATPVTTKCPPGQHKRGRC